MADNSDHDLNDISSFLLDSHNTRSVFSENFTTADDLLPSGIFDDHVASSFDYTDSFGESLVAVAKEAKETVVHVSPPTSVLLNKDVRVGVGCKIGFKIKSDLEILDDGFNWRKYGKKRVKNNPNPRNYYRCSTEGCRVKKKVERDPEDSRFVMVVYDGAHNHSNVNC